MVDLFRYRHWDLVSKRSFYYVFSAIIIIAGIVTFFTKGPNLGIDFKGGGLVTYRMQASLPTEKHNLIISGIRTAIDEARLQNEVQISPGALAGSGDQILVRTLLTTVSEKEADDRLDEQIKTIITPAVEKVVKEHDPQAKPVLDSKELVTGTVSRELVQNGILAVILGSLLILVWIWLRYNIAGAGLRYSAAAIIALLHDLLLMVGVFIMMNGLMNSPFIAALLTVLGYSIHDTIVIFDRIRENVRLRKGRTFAETVNISLLETLARSVNTVLSTLFTLLALYFFGGPTLRDFVLAMLLGVFFGGYSSIFIASQVLVSWAKGKDKTILPPGEPALAPASAAPVAAAQPVIVGSAEIPATASQAKAPASKEAIQRARQAGRSTKKRR
ncbi:MAG: protein translocase subunit SecF [Armatimonadota bacterium]